MREVLPIGRPSLHRNGRVIQSGGAPIALSGGLQVGAAPADALGMSDEREPSSHRDARAYDAPLPAGDRWLCDYLRRTDPDLLRAMYRADFVPDFPPIPSADAPDLV